MVSRARVLRIALLVLLIVVPAANLPAQPLPIVAPETQGFSPERLERLHARLREYVERGDHAGVAMLVARNGKIVDWQSWGLRDRERNLPMEKDTIVRIYSMSKIVTSAAVMQLVEQARIGLGDPVEKYLPALAKRRVFAGGTAKAPVTVRAKRSVTVRDLLTHTAGYIYPYMFGKNPLDEIYGNAALEKAATTDDFIARLAKLPLAHQPGERFTYGVNIDVLGAIVEKVSGQSLGDYIARHIAGPLKMVDTAFDVAPEKRARLAAVYAGASGSWGEIGKDGSQVLVKELFMTSIEKSGMHWGGAGLFSTIGDCARFGQMLLNGGELDGVRVLGRKTVEQMLTNQLTHTLKPTNQFSDTDGFGYGGAVRTDLAKPTQLGSVGQFGWTGAATTYFNLDPQEKTLALVFAQHFPHNQHQMFQAFSTLFYASLVD